MTLDMSYHIPTREERVIPQPGAFIVVADDGCQAGLRACRKEGDVSLWHTIRGRETLDHFPCVPKGIDVGMNAISYFCSAAETPECKIADLCPLRPIYEEYRALRAVVKSELAGTTSKQTAKGYRKMAAQRHLADWQRARAATRAEAWEGIA